MRCPTHRYTCSSLDATLHYTVCKHVHLVQMKISKNGIDISAIEQNKNKCSHTKIHMISETPKRLPVPRDSQGTKMKDNSASLESKDMSTDLGAYGLKEQDVHNNYRLRRAGCVIRHR